MGVMLDTNWRKLEGTNDVSGWPTPGRGAGPDAYDQIATAAASYARCGFSAVRFPPSTKGAAGAFSAGYDLFDPYDIGSKVQPYEVATGFGTAEGLRRAVAAVHAAGMQAYGDLVLHQYDGGSGNTYTPLGADGRTKNGRFPKSPSCFVGPPPGVAVDPVPDTSGNFGFGAMASYVNSTPPGYMLDGTIAATRWLRATTGFDGFRIDDVKGTNWNAVRAVLEAPGLSDAYAFGEYFDGNSGAISNWVDTLMGRRAGALDFGFKFNVGTICNNNSRCWMGQLADIGYCGVDPAMAVTFAESADTDNSPGEQIVWNKVLAYALMMTFPGYPTVYYRDWSAEPGCYGLAEPINNLVWIHEHLANGPFIPRLDTDSQVFIHERGGEGELPGCIAGFNNDRWNTYTRTVQTTLGPNQRLHEYTGKYGDIWTDSQGNATFTLPKNDDGYGFLVFAKWIEPQGFSFKPLPVTQTFFGASDLDIAPVIDGPSVLVGRVYVGVGCSIAIGLDVTTDGWIATSSVLVSLVDPAGIPEAIGFATFPDGTFSHFGSAVAEGWHALLLGGSGLPVGGSSFNLSVTYTSSREILA